MHYSRSSSVKKRHMVHLFRSPCLRCMCISCANHLLAGYRICVGDTLSIHPHAACSWIGRICENQRRKGAKRHNSQHRSRHKSKVRKSFMICYPKRCSRTDCKYMHLTAPLCQGTSLLYEVCEVLTPTNSARLLHIHNGNRGAAAWMHGAVNNHMFKRQMV